MTSINKKSVKKCLVFVTVLGVIGLPVAWFVNQHLVNEKMAQINKERAIALKDTPKPPVVINLRKAVSAAPLSLKEYVTAKINSDRNLSEKTRKKYLSELKNNDKANKPGVDKKIASVNEKSSESSQMVASINKMALEIKKLVVTNELTAAQTALTKNKIALYKLNKSMQSKNIVAGAKPVPVIYTASLTALYKVNGVKMASLAIGGKFYNVAQYKSYQNLGFKVINIGANNIILATLDGKKSINLYLSGN